jgi:hypothetical protein
VRTQKPKPLKLTKIDVYGITGHGVRDREYADVLKVKLGAPADMLRYDSAFECAEFKGIIVIPTFASQGFGVIGGKLTEGRWRSFSIRINVLDDQLVNDVRMHFRNYPDKWITWQHQQDEWGAHNYGMLVPVTLYDYINGTQGETR